MNVTAKLGLDFRPGFRLSFGGPQRCLGGVVSGPPNSWGSAMTPWNLQESTT